MATVVEVSDVEGFILDDLVAGVLDNTVYTLGGVTFADVSVFVRTVSVARGKNRELDRFDAGTCAVVLNNEARAFDPQYASAQFGRLVVPRREVRVSTDGVRVFTGTVDDWNFLYDPSGESNAVIQATDEFTLLARQQTRTEVATVQDSGARVTAVLDMPSVNWPADRRSISEGESILGADTIEGNALDYLHTVEASEQGQLFISRDGVLTFLSRLDATPTTGSVVTFADDGTGIPFTGVAVNYGTELLVNSATVTSAAGTGVAENTRSQTAYGVTAESIATLVNSTEQLDNLADFIVSKYADPEYRFEAISMNLDTIGGANKATVLGMEIGDVILIKFTPNNIGTPIVQYGQIIKIDNGVREDRHDVTIGVASLDFTFLVLDDTVFGKLGSNALAF